MCMTEINKLKIEHARYKKALETFSKTRFISLADTHRIADCALNPPPPEPVTLANLLSALKTYSASHGVTYILFFRDESGGFEQCGERIFTFTSLQEAYNFLTHEN